MPHIVSSAVHAYIFHRLTARPLYLMLQIPAPQPSGRHTGCWSVLQGLIREEETAALACVRMLTDQTGLMPKHLWGINYMDMQFDPLADTINIAPAFVVEVADPTVTLAADYLGHRWVTYEQAREMVHQRGIRDGLYRAHEDVVSIHVRSEPVQTLGD